MKKGILYIISAPSGAGKTTLVNGILQKLQNIEVSVSYTTRKPRKNEIDKKDYFFISKTEFEKMLSNKDFLEYATVFDYFYGTSKSQINEKLQKGLDIILEIDWQGAQQVRKSMKNAVSIFILPPSLNEIEKRLVSRNQDSQDVIKKRLAKTIEEIKHYKEYDYIVINDDFKKAIEDLSSIFLANKLKTKNQVKQNGLILQYLLNEK